MINLATGESLQGKASAATSVSYTVTGMELAAALTEDYKTLAQNTLNLAAGALYTAPAGKSAFIKTVLLASTSVSAITVTLYVNGTGATNQIGVCIIPAGGHAIVNQYGWTVYDANGFQQFTGNVGATGPTGPTGPTGVTGATGPGVPNTRNLTAGSGLSGGGDLSADRTFDVNVDNSTIEIVTDTLDVKDAGITLAKMANLVSPAIVGRASGTTAGVPQALTAAQVAIILGLPISPVRDYGAKFDHRVVFDGATTGATGIITSATAAFVAADVGKRITLAGAGASGVVYVGSIVSLNSGTSVNVTPNTSTTVSGKGLQIHTDDLTAWNNIVTDVNALTSPGARIIMEKFGTNRSGISAQINTFTKQVTIEGIGGSYNHDTGDYTKGEGSCIAYVGTSQSTNGTFGAVLTFAPPSGGTAQSMIGPFLRDFHIDCRNGDMNNSLVGISLASTHGFVIDDVFIMDPGAVGLLIGVIQPGTAGALGEDKGADRGQIVNFRVRCLENSLFAVSGTATLATLTPTTTTSAVALTTSGQSLVLAAANGLPTAGYVWIMTAVGYPVLVNYTGGGGTTTLTGCTVSLADSINVPTTVSGSNVVCAVPNNATCALFDGDLTANTNLCVFEMWQMSVGTNWGPAALEYRNCDSISSRQLVINGGSSTATNAINRATRPGVRIMASSANVALPARNNVFYDGDPGAGGVLHLGVNNAGTKLTFPSGPNYWWNYQLGNAAPAPTIEIGSYMEWSANGGTAVPGVRNISQANQSPAAGALTQLTGSVMLLPPQAIQIGTILRWRVYMNKTAAGTVASLCNIRIGTLGTSADANVMQFSRTPTPVLDEAVVEIAYTITAIGASATGVGSYAAAHSAAGTTGFQNTINALVGTPTTFNSTSSGFLYASLSVTNGTAEVVSYQYVSAEIARIGLQGA